MSCRVFLALTSMVVGFSLFAGCDTSDSNGDSSTAKDGRSISAGQKLTGTFAATGSATDLLDTVGISFRADSGYTYEFRLSSSVAMIDSKILMPSGAEAPSTSPYISRGGAFWADSLVVPSGKSGTYSLVLIGIGSTAYTIELKASKGLPEGFAPADEFEADNAKSTAKSISADSVVQHRTIHGIGAEDNDEDWISIKCDSGKTYKVHYKDDGLNNGWMSVGVYASDSTKISTSMVFNSSTGVSSDAFPVVRSGTYFVRAIATSALSYTLAVTDSQGIPVTMVPDAYENDDVRSAAKLLPTDSTVQKRSIHGSAEDPADRDWIALKCDSGYTYYVHYWTEDYSPDLHVDIVTPDTTVDFLQQPYVIGQSRISTTLKRYISTSRFSVTKAGLFAINVYTDKAQTYSIAATRSKGLPEEEYPDAFESDNTLKTAKPIPTDRTVQRHTLPPFEGSSSNADVDWMSMKCDSGHTYKIHANHIGFETELVVYSADSIEVPTLFAIEDLDTTYILDRQFPVTKSGTYYLRVAKEFGGGYTYQVHVSDSLGLPLWARPDIGEPDQGADAAWRLSDSTRLDRRLEGPKDTDWVRIPVEANRLYSVATTNEDYVTSDAYLVADLFDSTGRIVATQSVLDDGYSRGQTYYSLADGFIKLRLSSKGATTSQVIPYSVRVTSKAILRDLWESDNTLKSAVSISSDSASITRWVGYRDVDWMRIQADSGRRVTVWVDLPNPGLPLNFFLFSPDSAIVAGSSIDAWYSTGKFSYLPVENGPLYLYVGISTENDKVDYAVRVENFPLDSTEPDGGLSTARLISTDSTRTKSVLSGTDADWRKFSAKAGMQYRIGWNDDLDVIVDAFDKDSSALKLSTGIYPNYRFLTANSDGTVYLRARLVDSASQTASALYLTVTELVDDSTEPANNKRATATPLPTDSTIVHGIVFGQDLDFFKLQLDSGSRYRFYSFAWPRIVWELRRADSSLVKEFENLIAYVPTVSGTYYLVLRNWDWSEVSKYGIAVKEVKPDGFEPNNQRDKATLLPTDGTVQAHSLIGSDIDWISFQADSGVGYSIQTKNSDYINVSAQLESGESVDVYSNVINNSRFGEAVFVKPGAKRIIYVQVSSSSSLSYFMTDYSIRLVPRAY